MCMRDRNKEIQLERDREKFSVKKGKNVAFKRERCKRELDRGKEGGILWLNTLRMHLFRKEKWRWVKKTNKEERVRGDRNRETNAAGESEGEINMKG